MSVAAAGYLRIGAQDVTAWMDFGTGVLGLMEADREDAGGARFLRMDDHPFRFMIEPGENDGLIAAGLEYPDQTAWQSTLDALAAAQGRHLSIAVGEALHAAGLADPHRFARIFYYSGI